MQPIRPEMRRQLLERKGVTENDIDEYQRLQGQKFFFDPDLPMSPMQAKVKVGLEKKLHELYEKLFG